MSTRIGRVHGPVHTGRGDLIITGPRDRSTSTTSAHVGEGQQVEITDDGQVYVDGVLIEDES